MNSVERKLTSSKLLSQFIILQNCHLFKLNPELLFYVYAFKWTEPGVVDD